MVKVKMADIAKEAGVSLSCVARCINKSGYVSEEKAEKITAAAMKLGYLPDRQAKILRGRGSGLIGHIRTHSRENFMFSQMAAAIEKEAFSRGYLTVSLPYEEGKCSFRQMFDTLLGYRVEGIIINCSIDDKYTSEVQRCARDIEVPVVMIERPLNLYEVDRVLFDNSAGSFAAITRLLSAGHTKIGYIGKKRGSDVENERFRGYINALEINSISPDDSFIKETELYTAADGFAAAMELFKSKPEITAVFAASDLLAVGVYRAATELGLKIPDDISVIGYDDTAAIYLNPPLSTLRLPIEEAAVSAMDIIISKRGGNTVPGRTLSLCPMYVERGSVKNIK